MLKITHLPLKLLSIFALFLCISNVWANNCVQTELYYRFLMAEEKLRQGHFESAIKDLNYIISCEPDVLFPRKELIKVYAQTNQYDKAVEMAQEVLKQNTKDRETRFILSKLYLAQNRQMRAIATLERLLEEDPSDERALSLLTMIYLRQKKVDQAIGILKGLLQKAPTNPNIWIELARLYQEKEEFTKAKDAYKKALEIMPESAQWTLEYGEFLQKRKLFKEAEDLYKDFLQRNPEAFHIRQALLQLYLRQDRYQDALKLIEKIEKEIGPQPQVELRKALLLLDLSRDKEAEEILRGLLIQDPENEVARFYLGVTLERQGLKEEATATYESIPPDSKIFALAIRRLAVLVKDPAELKTLFERALEKKPEDKELYILAGTVFEDLDRCDIGYEFIKQGLEQFPDDQQLLLSAGFLLVCVGQEKKALEMVEPLLSKDPNNPTLLNFVGYTYAELNLELEKAEKLIKKALKLRPNNGYILDSLAWVYYHKGEYQKALDIIDKAIEKVDNDPIIYEHQGDILKILGREKEALEAYKKALSFVKKKRDKERLEKKIKDLCEKLSCS